MVVELEIVSGGQTGVDRGALDAALDRGVPCGGWCPQGRLAEDGRIPDRYPLREIEGGYVERTRRNVEDSDGTLIIHFGVPTGGTLATLEFCAELGRPFHLVDGNEVPATAAVSGVRRFVAEHGIRKLNVAGPRASGARDGNRYAYAVVRQLLMGAVASSPANDSRQDGA